MRDATAAGRALCLAIERRDIEGLMGWVMLLRVEGHAGLGDLGYWLGEPFHGQGFMTEAARATVADGFARFALEAVQAGAQPGNAASFGVMRTLGMTPIGPRTVWASARGREEICEYYAVTRAAFEALVG
jgi:RimJ/RimL family protein N-acetyltransferase